MAVPTSGNFEMFGTGSNTTIAGAMHNTGDAVSGIDNFNDLKAQANAGKFNYTYAGLVQSPNQDITSTYQFRGYPVDPGNCRAVWVDDTVDSNRYGARYILPSGQQIDISYGSLFGTPYNYGGQDGVVYNICSTVAPNTVDTTTNQTVDLGSSVVNLEDGGSCYVNSDCEWVPPPVIPTPTPTVPTPTPTVPTPTPNVDNVFTVERNSDGFSTYTQLAQGYSSQDQVTLSNDGNNCYTIQTTAYVLDPSIYPTITGACTPTPVVPTPTPNVPTPTATFYAEYKDCGDPTAPSTYFYRATNQWRTVVDFNGVCVEFIQTLSSDPGGTNNYDSFTKYDSCEACSPTPTPVVPTPTPTVPTPTPVVPTPTPTVTIYYARFVECSDPSGAVIQVTDSSPINTSLVLEKDGVCYEYLNEGGTGVDGDIDNLTQYNSCSECAPTPTPTPVVPTPTPTAPACIAITNQLGYSASTSTDACNAATSRYRADADTLANATVLYDSIDCSSIAPPGYYSDQTQTNWRYWTGSIFTTSGICEVY